MSTCQIVVISHACITSINRGIYEALYEEDFRLQLVIPAEVRYGKKTLSTDDPTAAYPLHQLKLTGDNPRLYTYEGLLPLLDRLRPRLVYLDNDPVTRLAGQLGAWCRKNDAKLVCQSCENLSIGLLDHYRRRGLKGLLPGALKQVLWWNSRRVVDHVFTINNDGSKIFKKLGYPSVSKIPLGFDPHIFRRDAQARASVRAELGLEHPVVAYFGRLVPEKGVDYLLEALATLKHLDWQLLLDQFDLYATDYTREIHQKLEQLGLKERTVFFEASHAEIYRYMNAADISVLPSVATLNWIEQYGRVIPESMACGCAVLASNVGALPELIGDCGTLVPQRDVPALAAAIAHLATDSVHRHALAEAGCLRAHEHLTVKVQQQLISRKLKELLA